MHKRTEACRFTPAVIGKMLRRDGGCIFCQKRFFMNNPYDWNYKILDAMHIVNKSQGGLGIEENGVIGCRYHHGLLDNGSKGLREEMLHIIEDYMKKLYPDWSREDLIYKK
jgi:predicted restriction endonuclease